MIERKFVAEKLKEFQIQEYIGKTLGDVGQSHIKLQKTPLGEKIIIFASRPGLVVGRGGENIRRLTKHLKEDFGLENPQIEISEVENINLDANIVAERIATSLERFGSSKFKGVGHKSIENVMAAGALGVEILISGKIPGSRAKRWRFYKGYLKKCGDISITGIRTAYKTANLKKGVIGIQVRIMPPDIELPDKIEFVKEVVVEENDDEVKDEEKKESSKSDLPLTRDEAIKLLKKHNKEKSDFNHYLESEAIMKALAKKLGEDEELWGMLGLLHDVDWGITKDNTKDHLTKAPDILKEAGFSDDFIQTIISHGYGFDCAGLKDKKRTKKVEHALACSETITGLIHAYALIRGSMEGMEAKGLKKKFKDKAFVAAINRDIIKECEKLGLELNDFFELAIDAVKSIAAEVDLVKTEEDKKE